MSDHVRYGSSVRRGVALVALASLGACASSDPSAVDSGNAEAVDSGDTTAIESEATSVGSETTITTDATVASSTSPASSIPEPTGDLYLAPQPLPPGAPGDLIWAEEVELALQPPATVWRMLYHSSSELGADIAVSGFAVVPTAAAPPEGRDVYAWAHGTAGMGDQCAPSRQIRENLPPYGGIMMEQAAVLVASDYEGLGTPSLPSTTEPRSDARSVLDSVRAARALPGVGQIDAVLVAGHSQGGAAALFAGQTAAEYTPELSLVGVVALAPGSE